MIIDRALSYFQLRNANAESDYKCPIQKSHYKILVGALPSIIASSYYNIGTCSLAGPNQCQDGVTNNCNQECIRDDITGVHICSCREGFNFSSGSETVCEG